MLQLYKYEGGAFRVFVPSAQTHVQTTDVERWMYEQADCSGGISNLSIEIHGVKIPLSHASEVHVVAALYAADHNDYVTLNLQYPMEVSSPIEEVDTSRDYDHDELWKLEADFEQNEDLVVNDFGPSHAANSDW